MPHFFYIIYSNSIDKYYMGETSNLEERLEYHNKKPNSRGYTKAANDWEYVLQYPCENALIAKKLERFVKQQKSRKFNENSISEISILTDIIEN